jgi:hypothetical protein
VHQNESQQERILQLDEVQNKLCVMDRKIEDLAGRAIDTVRTSIDHTR